MNVPRSEYPRPQFYRPSWQNLNDPWEFEIDQGNSGRERGMTQADYPYRQTIQLPFCPESPLSGIGCTDFMAAVWYRKTIFLTPEQLSGHVILHFGAVDYQATLWVNGEQSITHRGGFSSFEADITSLLRPGENTLVVQAVDDTRNGQYPSGKQSDQYQSYGCYYTRTTGIWQTVWLEFTPAVYLKQVKIQADAVSGGVSLEPVLVGDPAGLTLITTVLEQNRPVCRKSLPLSGGCGLYVLEVPHPRLWEPGRPELYDLTFELRRGEQVVDRVYSYFGFRSITIQGRGVCLNGRPVYQRLVLDQGFYPQGIYTAPRDEDFQQDISLALSLGFNGARLHQKVFEERFLYWADRMGYLVWGEYPSWGTDISSPSAALNLLPEWLEVVERDFNHPSIVCWCPLNETWDYQGRPQDDRIPATLYRATKALDPTRPVIDTSGHYHVLTDIYDIHCYDQDPAVFARQFGAVTDQQVYDNLPQRQHFNGAPYMVSEYGGASWAGSQENAWGYGENPKTEEEFARRYEGLTRPLLENPNIAGFCYTQLYDVEQEQNGLFTYQRQPKFSPQVYEIIRAVNLQKAALEQP